MSRNGLPVSSNSLERGQLAWPKWIQDFRRLLPVRSQFVFSGNIRDACLTPLQEGVVAPLPLLDCLWSAAAESGFQWLAVYDRVDAIRIFPQNPDVQMMAAKALNVSQVQGRVDCSIAKLPDILRRIIDGSTGPAMCVIDYASRIPVNIQSLSEGEHDFFVACEKMVHAARPVARKAADGSPVGVPLYNPVVWLLNQENDLPAWFVVGNEMIHSQVLGRPDYDARLRAAMLLLEQLPGDRTKAANESGDFAKEFASLTDGMSIQSMVSIMQLARAEGIAISGINDAVRLYKVGLPDNPWKKDYLRTRIRNAPNEIANRVKGQPQAITKTIEILMRSSMGLTGAQSASTSSGRPRGVLFFAGPTGVGKTELAKSLTELIFGDEHAYTRFDMSEFSAEHADQRLIGAPPGYVGYDSGGELTNAVRERPFSVILFDEIEKAHPRILDKFLQVLEDGRLTDGRGDTVYFSEAILIFTSNLGIFTDDANGSRIQAVHPGDAYDEIEAKVKQGIADYFKYILNRPELLNRFGDNIVVFNFITPPIAEQILEGMIRNVLRRVADEHKLDLVLAEPVTARIRDLCTKDLANGGRGIGNRLETVFINPLSRALFDSAFTSGQQLTVAGLSERDNLFELNIQCSSN